MAYSGLLGRNTDINGSIACATLIRHSTNDLAPRRNSLDVAFAFCHPPEGSTTSSSVGNFAILVWRNAVMIAGLKSSSDEYSSSFISDVWPFLKPKRSFAALAAV